jgi:hypothetical protein
MIKKIFLSATICLITISCNEKTAKVEQLGNSIIYSVQKGISENDTEKVYAVPIVVYYNKKYIDPPFCEFGDPKYLSKESITSCEKAEKILLPSVQPGNYLFELNNGKITRKTEVINTYQYGFSDWTTFSGQINSNTKSNLLTDNSKIGTNHLTINKDKPILEKRINPEGGKLNDKLIGQVDIDGDSKPELIYESSDYDGTFYQIYSYRKNKWKKVFEGGYQGV